MSDESVSVKLNENVSNVETTDGSSNNQAQSLQNDAASYDLNKFHMRRILSNNIRNKSIVLLGSFPDISTSNLAIVILEKQAFQDSDMAVSKYLTNPNTKCMSELIQQAKEMLSQEGLTQTAYVFSDFKVQTELINNIYGSYQCTPPAKLSGIKATVIYPATDKHIEKFSFNEKYLIYETPEFYEEITLPYITSKQFSLEWVYNIFEHKQETDRIIFEDYDPENGFVLLPDIKWDGKNVENLYVLAIIRKRNIKSLRDLNATHLPLLRKIRSKAVEEISKRYGICSAQLRMYFHYQPSFYHLHIHINPIRNEVPGIPCEKSHMLDTVINNLELLEDYYQKATLPFVLHEGNELFELYQSKIQDTLSNIDDERYIIKAKRVKLTESADHVEDIKT